MSKFTNKGPFFILGFVGFVAALALAWFVIYSLKPATVDGLPAIQLGHDSCAVCGMIISDQRFAVRAQSRLKGGTSQFYVFDDIGCFLHKVQEVQEAEWTGYVYDFDSIEQIILSEAKFEHGSTQTPMGSGWIAHKQAGDQTLSFDQIRQSPDMSLE